MFVWTRLIGSQSVSYLFVFFVYEHAGNGDTVSPVLHRCNGGVEEHGGGDHHDDVLRETCYAHDHASSVANKRTNDKREDEMIVEEKMIKMGRKKMGREIECDTNKNV